MKKNQNMFQLTWPIFVEMLLTVLVGNVDQFMLSGYSQQAVAAVGNANQIIYILILLFGVINLATMILSSQYIGSFQEKRALTVYNLSLFMNLIFSVVVSTIVFVFSRNIFEFMNVPLELRGQAVAYISIVGGFIFMQGLNTAFSTIFKTQNLMRHTMAISVVMNIVNVVGNSLLINGPGIFPALGVKGAAIATVISRFFGLCLYVVVLYRYTGIRIKKKYLSPFPFKELSKMLGIGLPSAGENLSYSLSQTFILRIVNQFGVYVINAKVYVTMFQWMSVLYSVSVSQVAQMLVSRLLGAKDIEGANKRIGKTLVYSILVAIVMSTFVFLISRPLVSIFTDNEQTLALVKKIMFIDIFLEVGKCSNVTLVRCLQATGDTKFPVVVGIVVMWIMAVGLSYVLGVVCGLGLVGVWIAMTIDELLRAAIFVVRWRSGVWRKFNLVD